MVKLFVIKNFLSIKKKMTDTNIIKLNDSLYKSNKNGLYYIMERVKLNNDIEEERITFWKEFVSTEKSYLEYYVNRYYNMEENNEEIPLKQGFIPVERRGSNVIEGLTYFDVVLREYRNIPELILNVFFQDRNDLYTIANTFKNLNCSLL